MKIDQPTASFMAHTMLRKAIAGLILLIGLALATGITVVSAEAQTGGFCSRFDGTPPAMDGWGACASAPNIVVDTSNVSSIGGATDYYLHLRDLAGASAACSADPKYTGDWIAKMGGCGQFCFDFKVFQSGSPPGPIAPSFTIWSGSAHATFIANFTVTSTDPWRQHICAPINLIQSGQNPPSNGSGAWHTTGNWNAIITAVTTVQLPIDWTGDPSEEAGYDNLCMSPGGCGLGLIKVCKVAGPGVPVGTPFAFTVGSTAITVPAGAAPAGTCVDGPSLPVGTAVIVTETIPAGDAVSSITAAPPAQLVNVNLATGTANVTVGSGVTAVTYTNICANPDGCGGHVVVTGCLQDMKAGVKCNPEGTYTLTLSGAGFTGRDITLTSQTAGVTVTPPQQAGAATTSWTLVGGTPGQTVTLTANATQVGGGSQPGTDSCCSGEIKITIPDCPKPQPVDVAITKTGGTSPVPQVNGYAFHLAVTNVAAAFNGTNAITVTDVVPPGMTFNTATGTNWSCATLPVAAGGTLTCTYTGTGPTAPSQALGTIDIGASAAGSAPFPPFTNCATVGLTPASHLEDTNPANNRACVTVVKPINCLPPLGAGGTAGKCVCPAGTTPVGQVCVRPLPACTPPMVAGPVAGSCGCPQGTVQRGRECVPERAVPQLPPGSPGLFVPGGSHEPSREAPRLSR